LADITKLPDNLIGRDDRERLEAFGGHTIARGRATRWQWAEDASGDEHFEMFVGGPDERYAAQVLRDREADCFLAYDGGGRELARGDLAHVMASLEQYFMDLHGESPDAPA
jgi:hypothetical protein